MKKKIDRFQKYCSTSSSVCKQEKVCTKNAKKAV